MTIALDHRLQAPDSVRAAARRIGGWHAGDAPDPRTLLWQRRLTEYTRDRIRRSAASDDGAGYAEPVDIASAIGPSE